MSQDGWGVQPVDFNHPAQGVIQILDREAGRVEEYLPDGVTPRKKVALVGFARSSAMDAPFHDPEFSIWGMNQLYRFIPRASRWFDIHHNWNEYVVPGTDHAAWIRDAPIPVYMNDYHPEFSSSVRYPIERMIEKFGDYYTSTVAYMLALAIDEGFTQIDLYGIDLAVGVEYVEQRPCTEYYIGIASERGITVGIPTASALCKQSYRYGYHYSTTNQGIATRGDLEKRKRDLLFKRDKALQDLHYIEGALTELDMWIEGLDARAHQVKWSP